MDSRWSYLVNYIFHIISQITSLFMHASPIFGRLPATLLSKLDRFQRRAHGLICSPDCDCDNFPSLSLKFENAAIKLLLRAELSSEHPLHRFVPGRLRASGRLRLPSITTGRRLDSFLPWASLLLNSRI